MHIIIDPGSKIRVVFMTLFATAALFSFTLETPPSVVKVSSFGKQPTMALDAANNLHVTFGQGNEIFYSARSEEHTSELQSPC